MKTRAAVLHQIGLAAPTPPASRWSSKSSTSTRRHDDRTGDRDFLSVPPAAHVPEIIDAGLRVGKLGNSSVRYEIGLFRQGNPEPAATGHFVHVFVDRQTRKPTVMPPGIRACLERLLSV